MPDRLCKRCGVELVRIAYRYQRKNLPSLVWRCVCCGLDWGAEKQETVLIVPSLPDPEPAPPVVRRPDPEPRQIVWDF